MWRSGQAVDCVSLRWAQWHWTVLLQWSDKQGVVNGAAVAEEIAHCFLKAGQFCLFEWFGFIFRLSELFFGTADWLCPWMGGMLQFSRCRVHKVIKSFLNAPVHEEIDGAIFAVPVEVDAEEFGAIPVGGDLSGFVEGINKVLGVCQVGARDAKVVNNESEY